ncbi:MAG: late competence development ComFB family protein [Synechococcales cyanobacterium RM1_1_8]|nr:late competence development ComFB family protein [Synechococcales cyanobacterium RM1_1_8]
MSRPSKPYCNAMEPLVEQEVQRQISQLPANAIAHVNPADVVAYALNFLPSLYATTEEGWNWQQTRAKRELQGQISEAVCQGLMVVHQSPQRAESRLYSAEDSLFDAQRSLQELALYLGAPNLNWSSLVPTVKRAIFQVNQQALQQSLQQSSRSV